MKPSGLLLCCCLLAGNTVHAQVDQVARPVARNAGGTTAPNYPRYAIIDLGSGMNPARLRNNGWVLINGSDGNCYRWKAGVFEQLTYPADPTGYVSGIDMNNSGVVVGSIFHDDTSDNAERFACMQWSAASAVGTKTSSPAGGQVPNLYAASHAGLTLKDANFTAVNDDGDTYLTVFTGGSYIPYPDSYQSATQYCFHNAYQWLSGSSPMQISFAQNTTDPGNDPGYPVVDNWINYADTINRCNAAGRTIGIRLTHLAQQRSPNEPISWLPIPDSPVEIIDGQAVDFAPAALNEAGTVVGTGAAGVVLWTSSTSEQTIGSGSPVAINDATRLVSDGQGGTVSAAAPQILGYRYDSNYNAIPALWELTTDRSHYVCDDLQDLVPNGSGWALASAIDLNDQGAIVGYGTYQGQGHGFLLLPVELGVDANRDGTIVLINEQSSPANLNATSGQPLPMDTTSIAQPFCFWWNNGIDGFETVSDFPVSNTTVSVQADLDPSSALDINGPALNYQVGSITCTRDLQNFARLWVYAIGNAMFTSGQITVGLEWDSNTGDATNGWGANDGYPAINIYTAAPQHGSTINTGGADYLTDPSTAADQVLTYGDSIGTAARGQPFYFPASTFVTTNDSNPKNYFLFEGAAAGKGRLVVTFNLSNPAGGYTKIGSGGQVFMDIEDIKLFYERWTVGDGPSPNPNAPSWGQYSGGGLPSSQAIISNARLPSGVTTGFTYGSGATSPGLSLPTDPQVNQYILFIHGYNMQPWEKDAFAATMLKRLYWQGYKGKFGAFQWPDAYHTSGLGALFDYDMSEYSSWWSAFPFKYLVEQLAGKYSGVYALGHSQGNIVISEALRLAALNNETLLSGYVASQAALPVQCYDATQQTPPGFFPASGRTRRKTPNVYPNWMQNNNAASAAIGNFFNVNDWALSDAIWQRDERLKPDRRSGPNPPYSFTGNIDAVPIVDGFANKLGALHLANENSNNDQYEIMACAAQAQCLALGAVQLAPTNAQGLVPTNLASLWGSDPYLHNFTDHVWHSAEFEFSNADQQNYWHAVLKSFLLINQ